MLPKLKKNIDGSLTHPHQKDSTGQAGEANWLPPNGPDLFGHAALFFNWPQNRP